jgi:hypothetical protein
MLNASGLLGIGMGMGMGSICAIVHANNDIRLEAPQHLIR